MAEDHGGWRTPRILVGVDGSETSLRAGAYAAGVARREHADLVYLFVHTNSSMATMAPGAVAAVSQTQRDVLSEVRELVDSHATSMGITARLLERTGNPYRELLKVAGELRVDAVIVGASMQSGHRFIGSLAVHLVRDAKWPVTVVP
jgi:nucleotide-binding universal stress UspA family protein